MLFIKGSGLKEKIMLEMVGEFRYGQMDPDMMAFGKMEWLTEEVDSYTQMAMYIPVSGRKTRLMGLEYSKIIMEVDTKAIGLMINNMVKALRLGLTDQLMKASI